MLCFENEAIECQELVLGNLVLDPVWVLQFFVWKWQVDVRSVEKEPCWFLPGVMSLKLQEAVYSSSVWSAQLPNHCGGQWSWLLCGNCLTQIYCCVLVVQSIDLYCSDPQKALKLYVRWWAMAEPELIMWVSNAFELLPMRGVADRKARVKRCFPAIAVTVFRMISH